MLTVLVVSASACSVSVVWKTFSRRWAYFAAPNKQISENVDQPKPTKRFGDCHETTRDICQPY